MSFTSGCDSPSAPEKSGQVQPTKTAKRQPTTLLSGRSAFQQLFIAARNWAPDAMPLKMESHPRKEDGQAGKASVWAATFVSPEKKSLRSFLWSGADADDAPEQGITPGNMSIFSPSNISTQPFNINFLKVDTDTSLVTANQKGGAAVLKKNPDLLMRYILFWDPIKGRLAWKVVFGVSETQAKATIVVDATTGVFIKKE